MEQKQTAIQRLIEMAEGFCKSLEEDKVKYASSENMVMHFTNIIQGANYVKAFAEQQLDRERTQIENAFRDGEANVWDRHKNENDFEFENPKDYFEKTFVNKTESL